MRSTMVFGGKEEGRICFFFFFKSFKSQEGTKLSMVAALKGGGHPTSRSLSSFLFFPCGSPRKERISLRTFINSYYVRGEIQKENKNKRKRKRKR